MKAAQFIRANTQRTNVQVHCSNDHDTTLGIEDVAIVHANGVVVGYRFRCPTCATDNDVAASAETIAVLHAFGVRTLAPAAHAPAVAVSAQREAVSLRVLIDDPALAAALLAGPAKVADAPVEEQSGSPSP